jgi:hypothetical protein
MAVLVLAGCASVPKKDLMIEVQADPKCNFDGYETYAWLGSASILNDPEGQWEPPGFDADAEITYLINKALRKHDMMEYSASPDLIVSFAGGIDMAALKLNVDPETGISTTTINPRGGLIVALTDAETGKVVWLAAAEGDAAQKPDPEVAQARLKYVVKKMFKKLPK